ncbi:hypothetical protein PV328_003855 [Microctonus aethiopoides]|uniref:R3H domain-containing protein n=2 Tax=Microctonus aethiopoides TaxID=144406 RepID=A0AA39F9A7_9HYME|nr:hypothetical protein PV328_003855 [Microctonus aethiopoides]
MSLQDSLFIEEVENDVTLFAEDTKRKRVLIFPPTNNYRRFLIHQFIQENFSKLLHTFSIGQGLARRTVVCYKSDVISDPKLNGAPSRIRSEVKSSTSNMGVERPCSPSASPENSRQRQVKSTPAVEIYRPPPARRPRNVTTTAETSNSSLPTKIKQRRPDRAVYVPKARRGVDSETTSLPPPDESLCMKSNSNGDSKEPSHSNQRSFDACETSTSQNHDNMDVQEKNLSEVHQCDDISSSKNNVTLLTESREEVPGEINQVCTEIVDNSLENHIETSEYQVSGDDSNCLDNGNLKCQESSEPLIELEEYNVTNDVTKSQETLNIQAKDDDKKNEGTLVSGSVVSNVLIISNTDSNKSQDNNFVMDNVAAVEFRPSEKKPKKVARTKSKPALPPTSPVKINRDECDWDSLFDENGECLDPTLIEELTAAVGEVTVEKPKNVFKTFNRPIEVSNDEFAHVVEIYNFPSDFKTSDLAAVFSPFKNGGFELKWVDDTHCLGVFSSPLVAAEVLASDHQFVKTRPLSEATALSRTKARRSAEFLQPYRSRPETCAALARRLVTGALGVKLATAQQEREREKVLLREAKERRRLANKQREDAWEGIIAQK